ncbi:hypothetical protein Tco_0459378 [Tanacetum coccineum]
MTTLKFADTHNMVAFLSKPTESDGLEQIVNFLNAHSIRHALTINPTIYISCIEQFWSTVKAKTINGEVQLHALVDGKKIIVTEVSVRRDLQLADEEGVECLPNSTIFEQLALMGLMTTTWNEFSSTMASAIIYLATTQKFNFSKYIFESMIRNLDNLSSKFLMYPRKPKIKDTQVPQPSDPSKNVADEVVHKELGGSLVRAATTASSLEVEQDSGGGSRCQETIGNTTARTTFERVSKHSNDLLLTRGNTLRSDENRLKLDELMALCTALQKSVLDLEKTKTTQQNEIDSLKRRVKKIKNKKRSKTHMLKRLYKVGLTVRVESSDNEESLGEDASKQGRIDAIDADKEITLVNVHDMDVAEREVVVKEVNDEVNVVEEVVEVINTAKLIFDAAQVSVAGDIVSAASVATNVSAAITVSAATTTSAATATTTATITTVDDITLAQALEEMKSIKPKQKGVVIQELGNSTTTKSSQQS